uniref:IMP dehydrogenase/GMP reductase domain-containing protein n=1 Tax=Fervidicoccus fontis TaxID=683846 RepID=A0A7J3ZK46_9CREN
MDTITEWRLAVQLARLGGTGIARGNMSVEEKVEHVRMVETREPSVWAVVLRVKVEEASSRRSARKRQGHWKLPEQLGGER